MNISSNNDFFSRYTIKFSQFKINSTKIISHKDGALQYFVDVWRQLFFENMLNRLTGLTEKRTSTQLIFEKM